jgi:hypothetical protein
MNALVQIGWVRMRNIVLTTTYPALTDTLIDSFSPHYSPLLFISRRPRHQLVATVAGSSTNPFTILCGSITTGGLK